MVLLVVLQALPPRRFGLPKLLLIPVAAVEGILIIGLLWNRMRRLKA